MAKATPQMSATPRKAAKPAAPPAAIRAKPAKAKAAPAKSAVPKAAAAKTPAPKSPAPKATAKSGPAKPAPAKSTAKATPARTTVKAQPAATVAVKKEPPAAPAPVVAAPPAKSKPAKASKAKAVAVEPEPVVYVSAFAVGETVSHKTFGPGRVAGIDGERLLIEFKGVGTKMIIDSFVQPAGGKKR